MSNEACILTSRDFAILESMAGETPSSDPLLPLLRRKLERATVTFGNDVPADVATLGSRVAFRINEAGREIRVLSHGRITSPVGLLLPITIPRGLALLGLREGQAATLDLPDGLSERVVLDEVVYQPEAARKLAEATQAAAPAARRAAWRIIQGDGNSRPVAPPSSGPTDDPGPSAA
jgi:regulator of nucleoside diphosphate kinase